MAIIPAGCSRRQLNILSKINGQVLGPALWHSLGVLNYTFVTWESVCHNNIIWSRSSTSFRSLFKVSQSLLFSFGTLLQKSLDDSAYAGISQRVLPKGAVLCCSSTLLAPPLAESMGRTKGSRAETDSAPEHANVIIDALPSLIVWQ